MNRKNSFFLFSAVALGTAVYNYLKPIKSNVEGAENFDIKNLIGEWYDIAHLRGLNKRNLKNIRQMFEYDASCTLRLITSGYNTKTQDLKKVVSKIKLPKSENLGALRIAIFGPFYSGYTIVHITEDNSCALVFADNTDNMWIISKRTILPEKIKKDYLEYAEACGYDVSKLFWTIHD